MSPEGEFVAEQRRELRTVAKRLIAGKIVVRSSGFRQMVCLRGMKA